MKEKDWTTNEPDIPEWIEVLDPHQKPIDPKDHNDEELAALFEKRIVALLQKSSSISSLDGWRNVAIDLACEFHPAFQLKAPKKLPVSGRPITAKHWMLKSSVLARKSKLEREAGGKPIPMAEAAREVAKERGAVEAKARIATRHLSANKSKSISKTPSSKTLENIASKRIPFPAEWNSTDYVLRADPRRFDSGALG